MARSRLVRRLRFILPVLAVVLIGLFILTSQNSNDDEAAFLDDLAVADVMTQEATVVKPTFAGIDNDGQPYEITAATATQDPNNDEIVALNDPRALLRDGNATTLATAKNGSFKSDDNILQLNENVTLERKISGSTYVLKSSEAVVAIEQKTVTSNSGVTGSADKGILSADSMEVFNDEGRIVFKGNVRMKFEPKAIGEISGLVTNEDTKKPQ